MCFLVEKDVCLKAINSNRSKRPLDFRNYVNKNRHLERFKKFLTSKIIYISLAIMKYDQSLKSNQLMRFPSV